MRLARALFVLPTLFTLTSVFCGLLSVLSAAEGRFGLAALSILFAIVFDSVDGRMARLTKTQSKFGIQIDSLADVVSFGVAPAVLLYQTSLNGVWGTGVLDWGMAPVFLYVSGGAIRLARYNVDAERKPGPVKNFTGLPVPGAAGCVAGLVLGLLEEGRALGPGAAAGLLAGLGLLMVSTVKYRKKMELREPAAAALVALALVVLAVTAAVAPAYTVLALFGFYIAAGLAEAVLVQLFRLRRFLVHGKSDRESPGR